MHRRHFLATGLAGLAGSVLAQQPTGPFDGLSQGGTVYDGSGAAPALADVAIPSELIVGIGVCGTAMAPRR